MFSDRLARESNWILSSADVYMQLHVVLSTADRDAGAEGREEGSVWLHAHQLTALNSPEDSSTCRHTENNPALNLYSCTAIHILTYFHNRHFIFFSVTSLLSEALIWIHAS